MTAARSVSSASSTRGSTVSASAKPTVRTFVLDTSVLLSDPWAVVRFAEHEVVLPLVVISELEGKRHHHELGWFARESLRMLDDLRIAVRASRSAGSHRNRERDTASRAQSHRPVSASGRLPDGHATIPGSLRAR